MKKYRLRIADQILKENLEASGLVLIEGTKWCGKTTTAERQSGSVIYLNDPSRRSTYMQLAQISPDVLLEGKTPRLVDEWQDAATLWTPRRATTCTSVGVAKNSPIFEEATEKGGYFFRQYPLVDNGVIVENEPKGKAIRKAICDRNGEIIVVMSGTPESFHDFAQALVDMRVNNAVYLVGSDSFGFFRDRFNHFTQIYEKRKGGYKYENYIKWVTK